MKNRCLSLHNNVLLSFLFVFFFAFSTFSFAFGYNTYSVQLFSTLTYLDYCQKKSGDYFTHTTIDLIESSYDKNNKPSALFKYDSKTFIDENKYHSYVLSYKNGLKKYSLSDSHNSNNVEIDFGSITEKAISSKLTFSDSQNMESMPLMLFYDNKKGNGMIGKNGATTGSYISASMADELISNNQSLKTYQDILDSEICYTISNNDGIFCKLSINNIYFDYCPSEGELVDEIKSFYAKYHKFNELFAYWTDSSIITSNTSLLNSGECIGCFEITRNYGNARDFVKQVIGTDFYEKGLLVEFYYQNGENIDLTTLNSINGFAKKRTALRIVFFFLAVVFFLLFLASLIILLKKCYFAKKRYFLLLFMLLPLLIVQTIPLIFGRNIILHSLFNYVGSGIILLAVVVAFVIALINLCKKRGLMR